jgi:hypothetical protein
MILALLGVSVTGFAADVTQDELKSLDEQVQDIKKDVLDLTTELNRLEEKLLFPSNSQVSLFVSLGDPKFRLDGVKVTLDDQEIAQYLYNFRELEALQKGSVQRIYTGNLKAGEHELVISVAGKASGGGDSRRSASFTLIKEVGPKFVEVTIAGSGGAGKVIEFKDW